MNTQELKLETVSVIFKVQKIISSICVSIEKCFFLYLAI